MSANKTHHVDVRTTEIGHRALSILALKRGYKTVSAYVRYLADLEIAQAVSTGELTEAEVFGQATEGTSDRRNEQLMATPHVYIFPKPPDGTETMCL